MANKKRPAISACLIVKNEERNLPRCLASLDGKVDEIIVVDTGSTDHTVALALEAKARVFHFEWCDDFSAARNVSLSHATGDYILWIDADDELVEQSPGALRRLCAGKTAAWGYFLDVHCPSNADSGESAAVVRQWRLFPRAATVRFEGRIHEHPAAPRVINTEDIRLQDGVHIIHWGYTLGGEELQRKLERNRRLIERCIADEPRQPRHHFNLGSQLAAEGKPADALAVLLRGIDGWFQAHGADLGYVPGMFAIAAGCAVSVAQPETALEIERRTPADLVSSDLLFHAGMACRQLNRTEEAAARWRRAITDPMAIRNILSDRACIQRAQCELDALPALLSPAVTACLIVKNEERDLPRCLASIRNAVDEIIVVDTGSSDRTVEIAKSYGARTFFFEWCDDFSAARNFSLRQASGQALLWVDADDELLEAEPGAIRRLCEQWPASSWAYWVDVHCPTDEWQEGKTIVKQPRLFRNAPGIEFRGRLHEQLQPADGYAPEALAFQDAISIKHWGYIPSPGSSTGRSERNRRILALEIAERPEDHFHHYNLALQYAGEKDFEVALPAFERAIDLWRKQPGARDGHVPSMFAMAALCAVEAGDYDKVLEIERTTPGAYVSADLVFQAGLAHWGKGDATKALARFDRALTDASLRLHNSHDSSTSSWRPLIMQAAVRMELKEFARARETAQKALEFAPTRPDAIYLLAHATYAVGQTDEAVRICRQALAGARDEGFKPKVRRLLLNIANDMDDSALAIEALQGDVDHLSPAGAVYVRARAYAASGQTGRQVELLTAGCAQFPDDPDIRLALSQALESQGLFAQAAEVLSEAMDHPPVPAVIYQRLAVLLARQGLLKDAANALELAGRAAAAPHPELVPA
jgi:glycosyltransferase involved in cell wall biosynthesis/Flp pilus assembly protein TadD